MMNLIFPKSTQRSLEYARGEYFSNIDLLEHAEQQSDDIKKIRETVIEFYNRESPELFDALSHFETKLDTMNSGIQGLVNEVTNCLYELHNVNTTLEQINYTLGYGFESLAIRLDKSNALLNEIKDILSKPVATQAAEFLERAKNYLKDGFYEEAEEDFLRVVDLDKSNYISWYLIGLIRSENLGNKDGAITTLLNCEKYASVRNKHYFSKSLLQRALITHKVDKDVDLAISLVSKSLEADSNNMLSHFFLAELYAEAGDFALASQQLQLCEPIDPIFYLRSANSTSLFESGVHAQVYDSITKTLKEYNKDTLNILEAYRLSVTELEKMIGDDSGLVKQLDDVSNLVKESSAEDYVLQRSVHDTLKKKCKQISLSVENGLKVLDERASQAINKTKIFKRDNDSARTEKEGAALSWAIGLSILLFIPFAFLINDIEIFKGIFEERFNTGIIPDLGPMERLTQFFHTIFHTIGFALFSLILLFLSIWVFLRIWRSVFNNSWELKAAVYDEEKSKSNYEEFTRKLGNLPIELGRKSGRNWYI